MSDDTTGTAKPKRLTLSEVTAMALQKGGGSKSSAVSLSRNASGETLIEVTVATGDGDDPATIEDAEQRANEVYARLVELYPPLADHDNAALSLSRNAKGETQVEVSGRTGAGVSTLEALAASIMASYDAMRGEYPMANGTAAKPGSVKP